jgi:hypothetical protein
MITKLILLLTLVSYSMVVSQSFMYIISLRQVQLKMQGPSYVELRKLLDIVMKANFKYVVYIALLCNLLLIVVLSGEPGSISFISAVVAFAALVIDTLITIKGSFPINSIINNWEPNSLPSDWQAYRSKWLQVFGYRQMANIVGFLSLLVGLVFNAR